MRLSLACACVVACVCAHAQPLPAERSLGVSDGLSGSVVFATAVDAAGFLWVGTQQSLDRWDGVRLRPFDVPGGVRVLAAGPDGRVWVGGPEGLSVVEPETGRVRRPRDPTAAADPFAGSTRAVVPDGRGGAWVGTEARGVFHAVPDRGRYGRVRGLPSDSVRALLRPRDAPGWLWVGSPAGLTRVRLGAEGAPETQRPGGDTAPVIGCADAGALVWCATRAGTLHGLDARTGATRRSLPVGPNPYTVAASAARPGVVWVGTRGRGLLAVDTETGAVSAALQDAAGHGQADVLGVAEDAAGLVWIGTVGGLYRADTRPPPFTAAPPIPGAPPVSALHEARSAPGVLWLGTIRSGLARVDRRTGSVRTWFADPSSPLSVIFAVHEDVRGRMWLGAPGGALVRFDPASGRTAPVPLTDVPGAVVFSIRDDAARPGVLWVGMQEGGLAEVDADAGRVLRRWGPGAPEPFGVPMGTVWTTLAAGDAPGVRWLATRDRGLLRLDVATGRITPAAAGCGLGRDVNALALAPDGALWAGGAAGLARVDRATGACRPATPDDGRPAEVYALHADARGRVWASTRTAGLLLHDPAAGTWARFTTADGLASDEFYIPASGRTATGEVLLGGPGGYVAFVPEAVLPPTAPPRVVLTRRLVEGVPADGPADGALELPHGRNDLAVEFAALDLRRPSANRYRARLDARGDTSETWTALGSQTSIRYPYLAAGRYTLRVAGAGPGGVWAEAAPLALTVRPPFWRRGGFWVFVGLLALGIVAGGYQLRIREILHLEATRRRIADDLHDDIGSKVSTVALRLELIGRGARLAEAEQKHLAELAETARGVVVDLRDAIWFVDAGHDDVGSLVDRIEIAAGQMLAGRPFSVGRPASLPARTLPMETRRHAFLWVREALHNACKYSHGHIDVRVDVRGGSLHVEVEDGGPGFDPARARRGRGMQTLAARAEALGGVYTLDTAPGQPTRLALRVPLERRAAPLNGHAPRIG